MVCYHMTLNNIANISSHPSFHQKLRCPSLFHSMLDASVEISRMLRLFGYSSKDPEWEEYSSK